ncbi:glycosyltransferase involved in cell wall biosynthesis [Wenyingzhuangia heitensis]|uniref:Glycosyltransferase involved in cell wall biosynthesis n=1 Tax=Wenyingzhuangia heitensis TaxID=1487859 RepID=A0ABX0U635_9FLAO|nr:glycosyltransferase [Wenyingzhuangia heitensis]NIJ44310.1 glycosyltransferase involved in cell wall biosynthesis [Wenyingzhuangia heitensis]
MKNKNIAIYLHDYSRLGGVERVTSNLSNLLTNNNIEVKAILSLQQSNSVPKIKFNKDVDIFVFEETSTKTSTFQAKITTYINSNKISHLIVQVQDLEEAYGLVNTTKTTNCKIIPVLHNSPFLYTKWYFPNKFSSIKSFLRALKMTFYWKPLNLSFFDKIIKETGRFVCVSHKAKNELKEITKNNNVLAIHNPLHFSEKYIFKDSDKKNKILYVGRLSQEKSPMQMVQLWERLSKKHVDWSFTVLGDGEELPKMKNYVKAHNIQNIELLGSVQNVESYMCESKISILMSYYEGLPTSLLEASFYNNALVGYNGDGGTSDIIEHNKNGFIHEIEDIESVEKSLDNLIKNESLLQGMMQASKKNLENFSDKVILESWKKLLK